MFDSSPSNELPLRINLGAGAHPLEGYVNIDRGYQSLDALRPGSSSWNHPGPMAHGEAFPLAYGDASAAEIRASHILEHFPQGQIADVLREWIRVLAPGGVLKLAVPNFTWIAQQALREDLTPQEGALLQSCVVGGQTDENGYHKAIFEREGLSGALYSLGLVDIQEWVSEIDDCASLPVSLNLSGRKPREGETIGPRIEIVDVDAPETENVRSSADAEMRIDNDDLVPILPSIPRNAVRAVMTTPRLGFVEFATCCEQMTASLGIAVQKSFGVFWDQGLTRAIQSEMLHFDPKYILTLDYDTVFEPEDVLRLYSILESRSSIDAVCAVQQRRELGTVLIGVADPETGKPAHQVSLSELSGETFACDTGHFGLTLIRASCFKALPKPWFCAKPNEQGDWGSGRTDADIAFWHAFKTAGFSLCQANRVVAGHIEMVVSWPDKQLRTITQPSGDYHAYGKPPKESNVWR